MKLTDIFEADVTSITQAGTNNRRVGADAKTAMQSFTDSQTITIPPTASAPVIKVGKRFSTANLDKALVAVGFPQDEIPPDTRIAHNYNDTPPSIWVQVNPRGLEKLQGLADTMRDRWIKQWYGRFATAISKVMGTIATNIKTSGFGSVIVELSPDFLNQSGSKSSLTTPNAPSKIREVLKSQNIGGVLNIKTTKTKSGYTVRIDGAEMIDERSKRALGIALRQVFGDTFISLKSDGVVDQLSNRDLGSGMTNYFLYFKPELSQAFTLTAG